VREPHGAVRHGVAVDVVAAKQFRYLGHLRGARRADRVALRLQAAREVDGEVPLRGRLAAAGRADPLARLVEAHRLQREHLRDGEAVVDLDEVHVARADAGVLVGLFYRAVRRRRAGEVLAVLQRHVVAALSRPGDGDGGVHVVRLGVLLADQYQRARAVADRTGVVEPERFGHRRGLQHVVDADRVLIVREFVAYRVLVVLDGDVGQVIAVAAVLVEVRLRHQRVRAGERHALPDLPQFVGRDGERLRRAGGAEIRHPLRAADEDDVLLPVADVAYRRPERRAGGRAGALVPGRRRSDAGRFGHQRPLVTLSFRQFPHEVPVSERLHVRPGDAGVRERVVAGVPEQVPSRALRSVPELGDADAGDSYLCH
jgi:hypothetical protein